jgi:hypothetical protein
MEKEFFKPEQESILEAAHLLGETFIQRKDMFASQLEDGRYVAIYEPLTENHLVHHLQGHITLGTYILTPESKARHMVIDADGDDGLVDLAEMSYQLETKGIPSYLETSRRGGHLWLFFKNFQEGVRVRALGNDILKAFGMEGTELFPKQGKLQSGPGSLVKLPFGIHKKSGQRYPFIKRDGSWIASTVREQIHLLSSPQTVPEVLLASYEVMEPESPEKPLPKASGTIYESSEIERVKMAVPLLDFISSFVALKPVASGGLGCCPFHDDHHPSFGVNKEGNYWQCFAGCGGGSIIDFWMKYKNVGFTEAVSELADILGVDK